MTLYMWLATAAYLLIVAGLFFRKKRTLHALLMGAGIFIDITIVLILEIERDAIQTAIDMSMSLPRQLHILTSALAVAVYIPVVALGILRLKRKYGARARHAHIVLGVTAFVLRTLGFAFMFTLIGR